MSIYKDSFYEEPFCFKIYVDGASFSSKMKHASIGGVGVHIENLDCTRILPSNIIPGNLINYYKDRKVVVYNDFGISTNQMCEILAAYMGLKYVYEFLYYLTSMIKEETGKETIDPLKIEIDLYSDSAYVVNCIQHQWIDSWDNNYWLTSENKPVKNIPLWLLLNDIIQHGDKSLPVYQLTYPRIIKVKGHSDNVGNNIADKLAVSAKQIGLNHFNERSSSLIESDESNLDYIILTKDGSIMNNGIINYDYVAQSNIDEFMKYIIMSKRYSLYPIKLFNWGDVFSRDSTKGDIYCNYSIWDDVFRR